MKKCCKCKNLFTHKVNIVETNGAYIEVTKIDYNGSYSIPFMYVCTNKECSNYCIAQILESEINI